ncbi:MAG: flagellar protein FlaG, partial [Steroidobacteraceae bacterium]
DIQALKAISSVAASPTDAGKQADIKAQAAMEKERPAPVIPVENDMAEDLQSLHAAVAEQLQDYLRSTSRDLNFQVEAGSGDAVLTVLDAGGNVVRRIPGEEAMQLMRRTNAQSGTLIDSIV